MTHLTHLFGGLRRRLAGALTMVALSTLGLGANAADRVILGAPAGVGQAALSSPSLRSNLQNLAAIAQDRGSVRVIVGVRAAFAPEGQLASATATKGATEWL